MVEMDKCFQIGPKYVSFKIVIYRLDFDDNHSNMIKVFSKSYFSYLVLDYIELFVSNGRRSNISNVFWSSNGVVSE